MEEKHPRDMTTQELLEKTKQLPNTRIALLTAPERNIIELAQALAAKLEELFWAPVANTVKENLDAALENDYLGSDDTPMNDWTDLEIAQDMVAFSESCQEFSAAELVPFIAEWRREHPNH